MVTDLLRRLKSLFRTTQKKQGRTCGVGSAYPHSHTRNCEEDAVVRFKFGGRKWHYYCKRHSEWPMIDRYMWEDDRVTVQFRRGERWRDWHCYKINTPGDERVYDDDGRMIVHD